MQNRIQGGVPIRNQDQAGRPCPLCQHATDAHGPGDVADDRKLTLDRFRPQQPHPSKTGR
jgi:hypothetical protein